MAPRRRWDWPGRISQAIVGLFVQKFARSVLLRTGCGHHSPTPRLQGGQVAHPLALHRAQTVLTILVLQGVGELCSVDLISRNPFREKMLRSRNDPHLGQRDRQGAASGSNLTLGAHA